MELGSKIRTFRNSLGLTQETLAGRAGIDRSTLQRIEGGEISPTVDTLWMLLAEMNVKLNLEMPQKEKTPKLVGTSTELLQSIESRLASLESKAPTPNPDLLKIWAKWDDAGPTMQSVVLFLVTGDGDQKIPREFQKELRAMRKLIPRRRTSKSSLV